MKTATFQSSQLSLQQERLWKLQQTNSPYRVQCAVTISGPLYMHALQLGMRHLLQHYEILRTVFRYLPGIDVPVQVVTEQQEVFCPQIDIEVLDIASQTALIDNLFSRIATAPFDLTEGPLLRTYVNSYFVTRASFIRLPANLVCRCRYT